jgi:tetratricopeptide (TPR) repeat protein/cyclophilin family peptidyl-prolyl cis-trans isomerase
MRTRLGLFCDKMIEAGWLAAVIVVPLFFNIYSQRVFEPDKLSVLRSIALVMSAAWLVRVAEDSRAGREVEGPRVPLRQRIFKTPMVLPTLLLVVVYLLSTLLSVNLKVSLMGSYQRLQGTYTTLSYIVIFFLMLDGLRTNRQLNRLITVLVLVSFPIAMYGLIQHFGLDPLPWGGDVTTRVASNMGNAIFVAAFLILTVPLTLSRLFENWRGAVGPFDSRDAILGVVAFLLLAAALLIGMFVRRGEDVAWIRWVALVVGVGLQVPIYLLSSPERRPRVLAISLPLTFAFLVAFSWILEIFFPPAQGSDASRYFWLGVLAAVVFVLAMAAFAAYLRRPVSRLLLMAGYFVVLISQIIAIFYAQSRGPLLGLLGGLIVYCALLGVVKRKLWLPWLMSGVAIAVGVFFILFNTVESPLMDTLRETPYVGRLGKVLQTEGGTGKVRVLIWEGVIDMVNWHEPIDFPGDQGGPDRLNALRPLIGYGPESMYVAYNRFYPPDLGHYEKRNASPDRSHNETFDALVITGAVGFLVYMLVFSSFFYFGLKWLGLIVERWQKLAFAGLWIGGGIIGAAAAWAWRGPVYLGVGIPAGVMLGLAVYVFILVLVATLRPASQPAAWGRFSLWLLALFSAVVAHFIEIHFGIAIAATRTYFWVFAAMLVVTGFRLAAQPSEAVQVTSEAITAPENAKPEPRRRRRGSAQAPQPRTLSAVDQDWRGSLLVVSLLVILILGTMLFNSVTIQPERTGLLGTIWRSLTSSRGEPSVVMLVLFLCTWGMAGLLSLSDLATRDESAGKSAKDWLGAVGIFALITFCGLLLFALAHASRLKPVTISSLDAPNPLANTITFYYVFVLFVMVALAAVLAFMFRRRVRDWGWTGALGDIGVIALAVTLALAVGVLVVATNISIIRADVFYKQGLSSEKARQWDGAIYFYEKAIELAGEQDFYYLFLGRAYMEKGKASPEAERDAWLRESEEALLEARRIAPLNTDHSANLARLHRTWGGLSEGDERTERLNKSLDYYEDATSLSPHNAQLLNEWAQAYLALGDTPQAMEKFDESLALDSEFVQTYLLLGEYYMRQQEWDRALEAYQKAVQVSPKAVDAYSSLAFVWTQVGDLDAALEAYQRAVELRPRNFNNRKNLAIVYQQMGRTEDAIREATRALELAPENQKEAIQNLLAQLGGQQPDLPPMETQQVQQLMAEGRALMDAKEWMAAEDSFQQVLELDPNNGQAHSALAYLYARQGRLDDAIAENLVVVSLLPNDYNSYKNLALLYQETGALDDAIDSGERALALAPEADRPVLQTFLDQVRQMQGETAPEAEIKQRAGDLMPAQRDNMYSAPPPMSIDPTKSYRATLETVKGNIVVDLAAADAPQTVNNFVFLSGEGFYDGLTFHRVENSPGFSLIQGGDPTGTGRGGPGYTVPAEIGLRHDEGAIATARLGDQANPSRASSGSQFYIGLVPIHQLDDGYTVFGYIVEGLDVAKAIAVSDEILTVVITEE